MPYRVLEDQIRHYAPARYLCALTETEWSPDHNTLHDFIELMGEDGTRLINEYVVEKAVDEKLADPKLMDYHQPSGLAGMRPLRHGVRSEHVGAHLP